MAQPNVGPAKLLEHATRLYETMDARAQTIEHEGLPVRAYVGSLPELFDELGISRGIYSILWKALHGTGCTTKLFTGSRHRPHTTALHHPPEETSWTKFHESNPKLRTLDYASLRQRLEDHHRIIGGLPSAQAIAELAENVGQIEQRLTAVETLLHSLTQPEIETE